MKTVRWIVILAALFNAASLGAAEEPTVRRALLVGISNYANHPQLPGASHDVQLMRSVLIGRFNFRPEDIQVLTDAAATGEAIRTTFQQFAERTPAEAVVVVHFSGYGGQLPDDRSEELDGLDETLVPTDATADGSGEIRDDQLDEWIAPLARKTKNVTVILDTCYVGAAIYGRAAGRCLTRDNSYRAQMTKGSSRDYSSASTPRERTQYTLLSAAQPLQIANEAVLGPGAYGAFTYELANALVNLPGQPTFQAVYDRVLARVRTRFPTQEPAFSMRDPNAPMFNDPGMLPEFVAFVNPAEKGMIRIGAGQFHGIERGARLDVYPPGTKDFSAARPIAGLEIIQLGAVASAGKLTGARSVPAGSIARRAAVSDSARLSVWFETGESGARAELGRLKQRLRDDPQMAVVENRAVAQLQVVAREDGFAILAGDLSPLNSRLHSSAELHDALRDMLRWFTVLRLSNPTSPLSIDVVVRRSKSEEPLRGVVRAGEVIEYSITNTSPQKVYVHTLLMSSDGTINMSAAKPIELDRGSAHKQRLGTFLPDDRQGVTDYIKVFAANRPLDLSPLTSRSGVNSEFLKKVDWATEQVSYELRRTVTRVSAFAVHTGPETRGLESKSSDQRTLCAEGGRCLSGRPLDKQGSLVIVDPPASRAIADDTRPGVAFQQAYEMRQQLSAERVEPLFDVALGTDLPGLEGRTGSGGENDPAAADDKMWSLNYVNAPSAWAAIQRDRGRRPGREAQGVRIAHLDTGYREHPELLYEDGDYATVLTKAGLDLVDGGEPYDTLSTSGAFPNPGHGTASGSVIVSVQGCQLKGGAAPCITGVALGAQLIPIRVNPSVVVLNQRRLAEAIMSVAEGRVGEKPQIISIAMGGPPSWALWRAVQAAERAGIIIVAAAGNNVGTVVWPARFNSVVAAGAINVRCRPWSGSSHGPRVDIAAPGESVWRAQVERDQQTNVIGMGTGTTFATAITTGAAALWVAKHEGEAEFQSLASSGGLTEAFRKAVKSTAWKPVADDSSRPKTYCESNVGWDSNEDGAGVLNIERMLSYPIDAAAARAALRTESTLPLFETVYPREVSPDLVATDYEQLFPPNKRDNIRQFEAEVMFHYAGNDTVRTAIDRVVAGERAPAEYENARRAMLLTDLSELLRQRLQP